MVTTGAEALGRPESGRPGKKQKAKRCKRHAVNLSQGGLSRTRATRVARGTRSILYTN